MKSRSADIIRKRADLHAKLVAFGELNMMHADKVRMASEVAQLHRDLAQHYQALSKELAYFMSRPAFPTYPE